MTDPRLAWLESEITADAQRAEGALRGDSQVFNHKSARHALAVVAAARRILALHQPDDEYAAACTACADERTISEMAHWPCPTVRAIASIWADRDGYAEEWGDA